MMLINKNILFSIDPLVIHGCNCQGKMNSGVAKAIRNRFPVAYKDYMEKYRDKKITLGNVDFVKTNENTIQYIGNCYTQFYYGYDGRPYASLEAITLCLIKVKEFCIQNNINSFSMPKIGCGLGGLPWNLVKENLENIFTSKEDIQVNVYEISGVHQDFA